MQALGTRVQARWLTRDDAKRSAIAGELLESTTNKEEPLLVISRDIKDRQCGRA